MSFHHQKPLTFNDLKPGILIYKKTYNNKPEFIDLECTFHLIEIKELLQFDQFKHIQKCYTMTFLSKKGAVILREQRRGTIDSWTKDYILIT